MARETEIKLRIKDRPSFVRALRKLRARPLRRRSAVRIRETNTVFDTPGQDLARQGQLLRMRTESAANSARGKRSASPLRVLLTFKSPLESTGGSPARHKIREEIELELSSADSFSKILAALGLRPSFRYEKFRTTYVLPAGARWARGLLIELDETPMGAFVELEGPPQAIDRAAVLLGFSPADHILANYRQLYLEDCRRRGVAPGDMLFPPQP